MSQCYFLNSSHCLLPLWCPQVSSLHWHLYFCPANRFISTIFLDSIYMFLIFEIFFLSDLLYSECIIDNLHNPHLSVIMVSHVTPYMIKKKCLLINCVVDAVEILPFLVEHVFLPVGEVWLLHKCRSTMQSERSTPSHFSHVRLSVILWTIAHQAPLSMGFSRQEYWRSSRGSSWPRDRTCVSYISCIAGGFFTHWATRG